MMGDGAAWMNGCVSEQRNGLKRTERYAWVGRWVNNWRAVDTGVGELVSGCMDRWNKYMA